MWNSRPRERSACSPDAPSRMLPRPTDTTPPDCARAEEDMATSHAPVDSYVRNAQARAQQSSRARSLPKVAREIQSGSDSSLYSDQILVIPSEVEESLSTE